RTRRGRRGSPTSICARTRRGRSWSGGTTGWAAGAGSWPCATRGRTRWPRPSGRLGPAAPPALRMAKRPAPHPAQRIDRDRALIFTFGGRSVVAYTGDTVASALYAWGLRVFARSVRYRRPRGLLCVAGRCPNCLVTVDGVPNVRACTEPARE